MGLFSKKTLVCERCGKEYQARIAIKPYWCKECGNILAEKSQDVAGYQSYAKKMKWDSYFPEEKCDEITAHRNAILEKYRVKKGITRDRMQNIGINCYSLSDDEAEDVLNRILNCEIHVTAGAAYCDKFIAPLAFDRTIVDIEDVFAVGYTTSKVYQIEGVEAILCALFTKDPYMPLVSMIYVGHKKFFESSKSKAGRAAVEAMFTGMCPNLLYPVQELGQLRKQIKREGCACESISKEEMIFYIDHAEIGIEAMNKDTQNNREIVFEIPYGTKELLDEYGYIEEREIERLMDWDRGKNKKFWESQINRAMLKAENKNRY